MYVDYGNISRTPPNFLLLNATSRKESSHVCITPKTDNFAKLGTPEKIWTIPAIHGDITALTSIHDRIMAHFRLGDRVLYHGNYTGYGDHSAACIDEVLTFRRMVLSTQGVLPSDFVYLKGAQEEIWQKLLQLQFAPDPTGVLLWMLGNGLSNTLYSYGISPHDGIEACRAGVMSITKWIAKIRAAVRCHAGHETFSNIQKRAAFTDESAAYPMLFVNAGLDVNKTIHEQGDNLWWAGREFDQISEAYAPFAKVVRGYDPQHKGLYLNCITATVDDGCGFGGSLISVGFDADGKAAQILET